MERRTGNKMMIMIMMMMTYYHCRYHHHPQYPCCCCCHCRCRCCCYNLCICLETHQCSVPICALMGVELNVANVGLLVYSSGFWSNRQCLSPFFFLPLDSLSLFQSITSHNPPLCIYKTKPPRGPTG